MPSISIIPPDAEFITPKFWDDWNINSMRLMEECGRVSHKSEGRITLNSAAPFLNRIAIRLGHESIIEHAGFTVCFVGSRSMSHQLVRHRLSAFTQESQRYCDYSVETKAPGETLQVIMPPSIMKGSKALWGRVVSEAEVAGLVVEAGPSGKMTLRSFLQDVAEREDLSGDTIEDGYEWCMDQLRSYKAYLRARERGIPSEDARSHLTNACKTEVYMTCNFRMWRHVLGHPNCGRALNDHAQWEIKMITYKVLEMFQRELPDLFSDLGKKITFEQDELAVIQKLINDGGVIDDECARVGMTKTIREKFWSKLTQMEELAKEWEAQL